MGSTDYKAIAKKIKDHFLRKRSSNRLAYCVALSCANEDGRFEQLSFQKGGLIYLEGWNRKFDLDQIESPKCFIDDQEIQLENVFRTYRPDVASTIGADQSYAGIVFVFKCKVFPNSKASVKFLLNEKCIAEVSEILEFETPHYSTLFEEKAVLHRENIYGSGPPSNSVSEDIMCLKHRLSPPVLDFGCGSGAFVQFLRNQGMEAYGIEMDRTEIRSALQTDCSNFITLYDGRLPLPYENNQFNSVTAIEVLEHIPDYRSFLAELARITKKSFVATVPDIGSIPICYPQNVVPWHLLEGSHVNFFTQESLKALLQAHFSNIQMAKIGVNITNGTRWYTSLLAIAEKL